VPLPSISVRLTFQAATKASTSPARTNSAIGKVLVYPIAEGDKVAALPHQLRGAIVLDGHAGQRDGCYYPRITAAGDADICLLHPRQSSNHGLEYLEWGDSIKRHDATASRGRR